MLDCGREVRVERMSGRYRQAARICPTDPWMVETQAPTGEWFGTYNAGEDIKELILEDNRNVIAVLMDGRQKYATCL